MVHRLQVAVVRSDSAPKCLFSSIHRYHPTSHYLPTSSFQFDRSVSPSANHQPTQTPLINRRSASLVFASLHTFMHTYLFRLCIRFSFPVHTTPCLSILSITSPRLPIYLLHQTYPTTAAYRAYTSPISSRLPNNPLNQLHLVSLPPFPSCM